MRECEVQSSLRYPSRVCRLSSQESLVLMEIELCVLKSKDDFLSINKNIQSSPQNFSTLVIILWRFWIILLSEETGILYFVRILAFDILLQILVDIEHFLKGAGMGSRLKMFKYSVFDLSSAHYLWIKFVVTLLSSLFKPRLLNQALCQ